MLSFHMHPVIDFHVHILPDPLQPYLSQWVDEGSLQKFRDQARNWLNPLRGLLHQVQPAMRMLPEGARRGADPLSILATLPGLLFESTPEDLKNVMERAHVGQAVAIAYPPHADNEYILAASLENPAIIPAVLIQHGSLNPGATLRKLHTQGARVLKIHAAHDGGGPDSSTYAELLGVARELAMPVIIHTGCIHSRVAFKNPEAGRADLYRPWFGDFKDVQFVLAHMNYHEPAIAMDLAEDFENVHLDTSWQPAEVIGEAIRRVGPSRIIFGSDWPIVGHNMEVGLKRIQDCVESGMLSAEEAELVTGGNAAKLLGIPCP